MREGNESWFWHANDMVVAGDMNLVVRVLWVALHRRHRRRDDGHALDRHEVARHERMTRHAAHATLAEP